MNELAAINRALLDAQIRNGQKGGGPELSKDGIFGSNSMERPGALGALGVPTIPTEWTRPMDEHPGLDEQQLGLVRGELIDIIAHQSATEEGK